MARSGWVRQAFGAAVLVASVAAPGTASAQSLGVFRWQTQPFCNVLTLAVTATASAFRLEGTDDQCGGAPASAIGMAFPNADGTVGVGLTLIFANAVALHVDATIIPSAGFNGSWRDSVGRGGILLLTPGASLGGPVRPVVAPVVTYGSVVAQPPGAADTGLAATVTTDTGTPNDAAGLLGRFGGALALTSPAPAGIRGESSSRVGVLGLTDTGFGVAGGADTGVGVQGYATAGASSIAVQAVHINGGTALEINNGAIRVAGGVRAAFRVTLPANSGGLASFTCTGLSHPLLNGDPTALVFVTPHAGGSAYARYESSFGNTWIICFSGAFAGPASVLVIKQ